jgi:hypothetical protein
MATKQRNQVKVVGDTVRLRFFVFNGSDFADPTSIEEVNIYKLFSTDTSDTNPFGRELIATVDGDDVTKEETGKYYIDVELASPTYTVGRYQDVWSIVFEPDSEVADAPQEFSIAPSTWFTDSMPIVHDFSFDFRPNRIRKGSKKYLEIATIPDVPRGTDKQRYYENMAAAGEIFISIEQKCGDCLPAERDLRLIVDNECITERDGCAGFYFLDTTDLDCGLYDVWFEAHLGPNVYVSDKQPLQIF